MSTVEDATKPSARREFTQRAARAWIRAADAGVIDADELTWLLAHLPPAKLGPAPADPGAGANR
jgi:hypothetical protein